MKYIQGAMSDFFKPKSSEKPKNDNSEDSSKQKEEQKLKKAEACGMGDYDYKNCPFNEEMEDEEFEKISRTTSILFSNIERELAHNFQERRTLEEKLKDLEEELLKRQDLYEACYNLHKKESVHVEQISAKIKKFSDNVDYHEEVTESWQVLIDQFRKIPEETSCR
ncbi:uncharacterized protein LOC126885920 [Diabrotica virgifera virgifera]|uniref:Uncharacterized protein LOC114340135 n=1 Tax=Diabrotica virgifera virgifera TaxID=50390 RepID=A0A6P7GL60_DIAVI|nr:uncharacterized protein LOC126885920 [Diabrotica virgifera virgifera]